MRTRRFVPRISVSLYGSLLIGASTIFAQTPGTPTPAPAPAAKPAQTAAAKPAEGADAKAAQEAKKPFQPEELEQLVAPIALYADTLLAQVMMASTYPLEVVEAARWVKANSKLKGDALTAALEKTTWDDSVKSLVNTPQVLSMMDEKLDWMQKLGDAVLGQQKELMEAVQRLRAKAQKEGNLKETTEQKVIVEQQTIKIEYANPQVIYVPTYNPTVVYGGWPYPAYPPYYYYPPGYVAGTALVSFGVGMAVGAAWSHAYGGCNWGSSEIDIDIDKNVNRNRNTNRENTKAQTTNRSGSGKGSWQHDPSHRKGASYRDSATAQKYNRGPSAATSQSREAFRGRTEPTNRASTGAANRAGASNTAGNRAGASNTAGNRAGAQNKASSGTFDVGRGSDVKQQADRGRQSRSSSASPSRSSSGSSSRPSGGSRSSGGGSRGGGGRGGGRGR